jgi:hypothetical protein
MAKYEIEFDAKPGKHRIAGLEDAHIERVAKRLKLWDGHGPFPDFKFYLDGEEAGGGGDK